MNDFEKPADNPDALLKKTESDLIACYDSIEGKDPNFAAVKEKLAGAIINYYECAFPEELPIHPDADRAVTDALDVVLRLRDAVKARSYDPNIEAVFIFSGGGTYDKKLLEGQPEWIRWGDRDRVKAGLAVAHEVTRSKMKLLGLNIEKQPTNEDYVAYGPLLIYPGNPTKNTSFREAVTETKIDYPPSKIKVIDTVHYDAGDIAIRHTGDQAKVLFDDFKSYKNIATIEHIPDYVRLPFYFQKESSARGEGKKFWAFALQSRRGSTQELREDTLGAHLMYEFVRLIRYIKKGDLSSKPIVFENLKD